MTIRTWQLCVGLASFSAALLAAGSATAKIGSYNCGDGASGSGTGGRGKTSPGLVCQVGYEYRGVDWGYTNAGQICNFDQKEKLMVHCPLLRTELESDNGLECASATLLHQQGNQAATAPPGCGLIQEREYSCILQSKDETGWFGWYQGWENPGAGYDFINQGAKVWSIDWRAKIFISHIANDELNHNGTYTLSCVLPPVETCGGQTCVGSLKWFEAAP